MRHSVHAVTSMAAAGASAVVMTVARDYVKSHRTGAVAPRNILVEQCVRDLLARPPAAWRSPVTIEVNSVHAERIILALRHVRLVKLTPGQVPMMLEQMARDGYATTTIAGAKGAPSRRAWSAGTSRCSPTRRAARLPGRGR